MVFLGDHPILATNMPPFLKALIRTYFENLKTLIVKLNSQTLFILFVDDSSVRFHIDQL